MYTIQYESDMFCSWVGLIVLLKVYSVMKYLLPHSHANRTRFVIMSVNNCLSPSDYDGY